MEQIKVKEGDQIFCIKADKTFGIKNHKVYTVKRVDKGYVFMLNDNGIEVGFNSNTSHFLDMTSAENLRKIRQLKLKRVFKIENKDI